MTRAFVCEALRRRVHFAPNPCQFGPWTLHSAPAVSSPQPSCARGLMTWRPLCGFSIALPNDRFWQVGDRTGRQPTESLKPLYLGLFGDLQRIVDFNSEVAHRALQLRVAQEQLHDAEVLGSPIYQRRLRPPQGVRAIALASRPISRIQPRAIRAYCRVDRCGDECSRLGNR